MKKLCIFLLVIGCCVACKKRPPNVRVVPIKQKWIKGKLYQKIKAEGDTTKGTKTIIITLSGFEGGHLPEESLLAFANQGYDIFSLAYAAPPSVLPQNFTEIPIEYLGKAVQWIKAQAQYKKHSIVLMGVSKGAELALLYGSYFKDIDGIIAYSPSCMRLPAISASNDTAQVKAPWSYQYKPLPFAPVAKIKANAKEVIYKEYITRWLSDREVYKKSRIQVENIACPVLLFSGDQDLLWEASKMSHLIQLSMEAGFKPHKIKNMVFKDAGHYFFWFGEQLPKKSRLEWKKNIADKEYTFKLGGTNQGNLNAMEDSQKQVFQFLYKLENPPSIDSLDQQFRKLSQ